MTKLAEAFARFAEDTGLGIGSPDENGFWHLSHEGVSVAFAEFDEGNWVRAWARVGMCPTQNRGEILEKLLAYGHPSRVTVAKAGSFSLENGDIFFQQLLPGWQLDLTLLSLSLHEVTEVVKRTRQALYEIPLPDLGDEPSDEPPADFVRFD